MKLRVVYCNHQTTELSLRERLSFGLGERARQAYQALSQRFPNTEFVLLSTCNRVEIYTAQEESGNPPTRQDVARFLSEFHRVPLTEFVDELIEEQGPDAVRHLFQVTCSLDSMVLGEPQIVSQVKQAYELAQTNEACGPLTHAMFQAAIRVSARVRTETRLSEGRVSIASVAVGEFAKSIFDRFDDKQVVVIGAGEMAQETLRYLQHEGVRSICVLNRNVGRAEQLAQQVDGAIARPFEELDEWLPRADVIVSATGAERPIITADRFARTRQQNDDKPVFILDLGAPRDFEPAVGDLDENVFLYDIDDLKATCERNRALRAREIERALQIVDEETQRFMQEIYHRATGPVVKRLRERWHEISAQEVQRLRCKLAHLSEEDLAQVERTVERIVNKLLHPPLETLREEAREGPPHGLLEALKRLFHLPD
ncbi:MAG: glutamyl-tRNA reductase [Planctomycetes bacterium]|nr:glutamyl-tRNA reductase [Planctomycetota bacterium]